MRGPFSNRTNRRKKERDLKEPTLGLTKLKISQGVHDDIYKTIGQLPAETGGALGGDRETGIVTHFHFDYSARRTGATYSPDADFLNRLFSEEWNPKGINLLGFVHSHPPGCRHPSGGDLHYARRILEYIPELDRLLLPIAISEADTGEFELLAFGAFRNGGDLGVERLDLEILANENPNPIDTQPNLAFDRVREAYDLNRLERSRVIYIGVGGAASFVEEMSRAGVGEHVLIDPDVVSETNIGTQQVYRRDIGRAKVDCIAERVKDINPRALVVGIPHRLEDIPDVDFKRLLFEPTNKREIPEAVLICGLTDDFFTQARVNLLALEYGVPSLCAQVYKEGRGAEITFTYPGITPACHRCITSSRYSAYLSEGFENNVTSNGTPIFSTARLNSLKGVLAMAMLHHGTSHPRWGQLLNRIGNRNLVQIRMDPDLEINLGIASFKKTFSGANPDRVLFDEAVWLPQAADCEASGYPTCPDCGGTGDLRNVIGKLGNTAELRI